MNNNYSNRNGLLDNNIILQKFIESPINDTIVRSRADTDPNESDVGLQMDKHTSSTSNSTSNEDTVTNLSNLSATSTSSKLKSPKCMLKSTISEQSLAKLQIEDNIFHNNDNNNSNNVSNENTNAPNTPKSKFTGLVVDDVLSNRKLLKKTLEKLGFEIDLANDGIELLNKIIITTGVHNSYDVIFLDNMMPNLAGVDAIKILRKDHYSGIVIGVTGNVLNEDLKEFRDAGCNDVLTKPVILTRLKDILIASGLNL